MGTAEAVVLAIAEDDDGQALLIQKILRRLGLKNEMIRFKDGQEALDYLCRTGSKSCVGIEKPHLLLLDINMPRVDGIEVLRVLKQNPLTAHIPIIMLTTTDSPAEIQLSYKLGCSVYVTKPIASDAFIDCLNKLGLFIEIVRVP